MFAFLRRYGRALLVTLGALAWAVMPFAAFSQTNPSLPETQLVATIENGFARLVFTLPEEIKADVQFTNNVLVIRFAKPVRVSIEGVQAQFKDFVQAARTDPDGNAVRIAFAQKISVNVMEAGEKLFVDLLPESWVGLPPGLPQEVVDELARRARAAERKARVVQEQPRVWQPVKVRFGDAPGFSRFAFSISEPMSISATQDGQELKITFAAPVKIDFGDVRANLPRSVASLDADYGDGATVVRLVIAPEATLRHFNEFSSFVVDVMPAAEGVKPLGALSPPQKDAEAEVSPQTQAAQQPTQNAERKPEQKPEEKPELEAQQVQTPLLPPEKAKPASIAKAPLTSEVRATVAPAPNGVRILFSFEEPVASAIFRRGDRVWIVFDTARQINVSDLIADRTRSFSDVSVTDTENGKVVRLRLRGGWLTSAESNGQNWTVHFGDAVVGAPRPLVVSRKNPESGAELSIPLDGASQGKVHKIDDPEVGDDLRVVTALAPVRSVLRGQDFLEFKLLPSAHGVALLPLADDLVVEPKKDHVAIGRPKGLALSKSNQPNNVRQERVLGAPLDATLWEAERNRRFRDRETELFALAANASAEQRIEARMSLATFYLAHGLATEAKGTLDSIVRVDAKATVGPRFYLLRGLSELMIGRPAKAIESLGNSELADSQDASLLKAVGYSELSDWATARENFRAGTPGLRLLPVDLQRLILFAALRAAIEVRDFTEAGRLMSELDATEVPEDIKAQFAVLAGRLSEGLGRLDRAENFFETVASSGEGPFAAEARYKLVELKLVRGEFDRSKATEKLEALSFGWRGDRIELESNRLLARLYVEEARYREAFRLLDAALLSQPNVPATRTFHTEMATVFEDLFLSGKADALPPIEALALYYDFSKLTPVGRRGDELIRRLSERLVAVDLLDQASELLEHQVRYRLTGAAKSQVATRLAIVHLMNRKPQKAIAILTGTRLADLPQEIREQRLLLESRALMGTNRFDNALDVISSLKGPEADRVRADILWTAKRWRQAGEAIELMLGERWKQDEPLDEIERSDVLRAGLSYALANENLSLSRLKEKFGAKMEGEPEKAAFDQISTNPNPRAIGAATKLLANIDSLAVFLKMYQAKYPAAQAPVRPAT